MPCPPCEDEKQNRVDIRKDLVDLVAENILKNVAMGDVTWVYGYDVETKTQCFLFKKHGKFGQCGSCVFVCWGVVLYEFLPRVLTVNKECYLKVKRLREPLRKEQDPNLWRGRKMVALSKAVWLIPHF